MRRYISYLALCGAMLLGVGVATAPVIKKANADLAYADGRTLYYKASVYDAESDNGNYSDFLDETDKDPSTGDAVIETIADTMRDRLDSWGLSEYTLEVQGYDTIAVSLRTKDNTDTQYEYLQNYLAFSGGDFELDASDTSGEDYSPQTAWEDIIDGQTARIEEIEQSGYNVPVVVVPLKSGNDYINALNDLVKYCEDNTTAEDPDNSVEGHDCNIVVWANRYDTDTYEEAQKDANVASRIVSVVSATNARWYDDDDDDKEYPQLQLIPSSEATSTTTYNAGKSAEAYEAAVYLRDMLNASSYGNYRVSYTYSENIKANVESMISYKDNWNLNPAMNRTLIALLACFAVAALILCLFNRALGIIQVASIAVTTFASFLAFVLFGTQFNVAALLGLAVVALNAAFGGIYYGAALKDEIYKGRTLKKANAEAGRRSFWPTIDASIVVIAIGVFVYLFAGDVASKLGTMMVLGGFFSALFNLVILRLSCWLLCNDSTMQSIYPKHMNVLKDRIPDLVKEEKQSYFGPYADKDFTKGKKVISILSGLCILAGIGTMIGFGVTNDGNVYNDAAARSSHTVLRIDVRSDDKSSITVSGLSTIQKVDNTSIAEGSEIDDVFHAVKINGKTLASYVDSEGLRLSETPKTVYDSFTEISYYWFYYEADLTSYFELYDDSGAAKNYTIATYNKATGNFDESEQALVDAVRDYVETSVEGTTDENFLLNFATVTPAVGAPYVQNVFLAIGVGIAVATVYLMIRFRPSRGLAAGLIACAASYIATSFFVFTRISVTPIVALGSVFAAAVTLLAAIFILGKEKDVIRESHEKDKSTFEFRSSCLKSANSRIAGSMILFLLLGAYFAIVLFGFGPTSFSQVFLCGIIGLIFAAGLVLSTMTPIALLFAKWLSKIHFKPRKAKKKPVGQIGKKKSAEPEEAIFIGIND